MKVCGAMMLVMILAPCLARADGGVVRSREAQGTFVVTIFTPPVFSRDIPAEITLMVQREGEVVMDAVVNLSFVAPECAEIPTGNMQCGSHSHPLSSIPATHTQAANKLLYTATVVLPAAGDWQLQASIERGGETVKLGCRIPVGLPSRRLIGLVPYLVLPPLMVSLFAINQCLRKQSLEKQPLSHEQQ